MEKKNQPTYCFGHFAMGTTFEIVIAGKDKTYAGQVSRAIFDEIDRIEGLFSRFNSCSDIGQINNLEPGQSLKVGVEVFECLETAAQIHQETNGAFDINIGSLLKYRWNTVRRSRKMSSETKQLPVDLSR
ncbi:MAG: FAD:protein FMN transferase, partial [Candidatus Aminicenantes bacterium]|nr:FAD:protein FMN transferase [Candidatus Aminicenantes bacterium]